MIYIIVLISLVLNIYLILRCAQLKNTVMLGNGRRTLKFVKNYRIR